MTEKTLIANGLHLAYDEFGCADHPVMLLVMGLGTQMIGWPEPFCESLAAKGYRVIRFDNRDIGLSEKIDAELPNLFKLVMMDKLGLPIKAPYTLYDMAQDTVGLLDALDIRQAHLVGASMGAMICQIVAGKYPQRALSLSSIMSTSGAKSLPGASARVTWHMLTRPKAQNEQAIVEHGMRTWQLIGSLAYPPEPSVLAERILRGIRRRYHPPGYVRQAAAILASGDRVNLLKSLALPTLVIHGKADLLVPVACGIDTARHVSGARLELIEGMGHDLPVELYSRVINLISETASAA